MRGLAPARRGTFVSAKVPKTIFPATCPISKKRCWGSLRFSEIKGLSRQAIPGLAGEFARPCANPDGPFLNFFRCSAASDGIGGQGSTLVAHPIWNKRVSKLHGCFLQALGLRWVGRSRMTPPSTAAHSGNKRSLSEPGSDSERASSRARRYGRGAQGTGLAGLANPASHPGGLFFGSFLLAAQKK